MIATTTTSETARRERVIPINLSTGLPSQPNVVLSNSGYTNATKNDSKNATSFTKPERVIPIHHEGTQSGLQGRKNNINGQTLISNQHQNGNNNEKSKPIPASRPGKFCFLMESGFNSITHFLRF